MSDRIHISIEDANSLLTSAFRAVGIAEQVAASVAQALVSAEAEGQVGHGFSRLGDYVAQVQSGKINTDARITLSQRGPASLLVDADLGFAYPALDCAFAAGVPLAREMGIAVLAIGNSHHCGALSLQVERFAQEGLIAIMVANAPSAIAPWGAREPLFGTNPIAFASPVADAPPLVIDLSLSKVARGKVMAAKKAGTEIPPNWALDEHGHPTTDPEAALKGTMIPIGEAKGTALALMVEILSAAFTGSAFSSEAGSFFHAEGHAPRVGQTLIVINPGAQSDYGARLADLLNTISAMEGARVPGERRRAAIEAAKSNGLLVPAAFIEQAKTFAQTA